MQRRFRQVDVFSSEACRGNPVAVVVDGDGLTTDRMQRFAAWTNLSETTFLLPATDPGADYRVRIFTPVAELPFAGHPTLGSCHAWLSTGGTPAADGTVEQQCGAGIVPVRRIADRLAFAAPPLRRSGPVDAGLVERIAGALGIGHAEVVDAQWVDNGPGWVAVLLGSAEAVLALRPGFIDADVGVVGPCPPDADTAFEVRAFFPVNGVMVEDPVTGSLNAGLAQWLVGTGRADTPYVVRQGTALGRAGRVHLTGDPDGGFWVGGTTATIVSGTVDL
jgi:PhzF family phenazine biosynthesis protein